MRIFPLRRENPEKETVSRNPNRLSCLPSSRALEESSGRLHQILFPGVDHPFDLSVALSRHTPFSLCRPAHPRVPLIPATPWSFDTRSPVRVFTRVLEFCQYHTLSAKQIDLSSPSERDFRTVHGLTDFSVGSEKLRGGYEDEPPIENVVSNVVATVNFATRIRTGRASHQITVAIPII